MAGLRSWKQFWLKNIWFCKIKVLLSALSLDVSLHLGGRVCFWGAVKYVHSVFFSLGLERWSEWCRGGRFSYRYWRGVHKEWQQEQQWVKQTPPKQQSPLALSCLTSCSDSCSAFSPTYRTGFKSKGLWKTVIDLLLASGPGKKPSLEGREKLHNMTKCVNDPLSESLWSVWKDVWTRWLTVFHKGKAQESQVI